MFSDFVFKPTASPIIYAFVAIFSLYVTAWVIYTRTFHPLHKIPGLFLASTEIEQDLHQKYGPVVRVAPDEIICATPEAVEKIYRIQNSLEKSDFYSPWSRRIFSKHTDVFAELRNKEHGERRRILSSFYTLTNVLRFEPFLDECSEVFMLKMEKLVDADEAIDLGQWLQWYTFDVVGQLFFGNMFGFMAKEKDHESWIQALDKLTPFILAMSIVPVYLRPFIGMTAVFSKAARYGIESMNLIIKATRDSVSKRAESSKSEDDDRYRCDLLQQMLDAVREKGEKVDFSVGDVHVEAYVAIFAGSETTAAAMRAIVYYLMKNPDIYRQVQAEIDEATTKGQLSSNVKYIEAVKLPLFCATVKEATRLHPSVSMSLPRMTPMGGIDIAGHHIPRGYRVGVNPAIIQRNKSIFGADANSFRPSRWLEENAVSMNRYMLSFGTGTRTCLGKHIALTEVYKLLPQFLRDFEIEADDPNATWTTKNMFIHKQNGVRARVRRRVSLA